MNPMDAVTRNDQQIPSGGAWAAIVAAGIGCFAFGILVDFAEASTAVSNILNRYNPAGDLSGKSCGAVLVWLLAWTILHLRWKNRNIDSPGKLTAIALILILLGLIAVFPPFFGLFAAG
jgi:hypothetical protein